MSTLQNKKINKTKKSNEKDPPKTDTIFKSSQRGVSFHLEDSLFNNLAPKNMDEKSTEELETKEDGYFKIKFNKNHTIEIFYDPSSKYEDKKLPKELEDLYIAINRANNIIEAMPNTDDKSTSRKHDYAYELYKISRMGLIGETPNTDFATKALMTLKEEVVLVEGGKIKNLHIRKLGWRAMIVGLVALAFAFFFRELSINNIIENTIFNDTYVYTYFFVIAGAMAGVWMAFCTNKLNIVFEDLVLMGKEKQDSTIKVFFVLIVSVVFMLFLSSSIIYFQLGDFDLSGIKENIETQLITGVIIGMVANKFAIAIYTKAKEVIVQ